MKRIKIEKYMVPSSFCPRIRFSKDDIEFMSFSMELIEDLTFKAPPGFPFKGPEMTVDESYEEIYTMVKNEMNDPELEEELKEAWDSFMFKK